MRKEFPVAGEDLKKIIKKSRQMPIAFGFNPGTSDEDDEYLAAHARKKPEVLGKLALHDGAGTKTAFGTFVTVRSEVRMTCFRILPNLAKRIKRYVKRNHLPLNVVVMDPDGNVIDSDFEDFGTWLEGDDQDDPDDLGADEADDDTAADDQISAALAAPDPALDKVVLTERLRELQRLMEAEPTGQPTVQAAFRMATQKLRDGDVEAAEKTVSTLEMVLARLAMQRRDKPAPAVSADATPAETPQQPRSAPSDDDDRRLVLLRRAVAQLAVRLSGFPASSPVRKRLAAVQARIDAGDAAQAATLLRGLRAALPAALSDHARWQRMAPILSRQIEGAVASGSVGDPEGLARDWRAVSQDAGLGFHDRAIARVPGLIAMLRS